MTENYTTGSTLRIRIIGLPTDNEFEEFDLRHFRVGEIYDVPMLLASLLLIAGYAEMAGGGHRIAEAADFGQVRFPRPKPKPKPKS